MQIIIGVNKPAAAAVGSTELSIILLKGMLETCKSFEIFSGTARQPRLSYTRFQNFSHPWTLCEQQKLILLISIKRKTNAI